jgi:hypothetical protein
MQNLFSWPIFAAIAGLVNIGMHALPFVSEYLRPVNIEVIVRIVIANIAIAAPILDVFSSYATYGVYEYGGAFLRTLGNVALIGVYAGLTMSVIHKPIAFVASVLSILAAVAIVFALRRFMRTKSGLQL